MKTPSIKLTRAGFGLALILLAAAPINSFAQEKGAAMLRLGNPNSGGHMDTAPSANSFAQEKGAAVMLRINNPNSGKRMDTVAPVNSSAQGQEKGATTILRLVSPSQREVQIAPLK